MLKRFCYVLGIAALVLSFSVQPQLGQVASVSAGSGAGPGSQFVKRMGSELWLNDRPFHFAGSNNYYLMYKSQFMVDDVLNTAAAHQFKVLRMWGSLEIGNQDGSNSVHGKADGVYFQYWDGTQPAYNDGSDGLEHLDYVIYRAGQLGIKLVIPLVNNWNAFGGMDQYVRWRNGQYHDEFYTDPVIKQWFKNWIAHLLNRTNLYTGVQYKNDPTIMTWELANEPRCLSAGVYPRSESCTTQTLVMWADEMSTYLKSVDRKHLVSVGDEGFYCTPGAEDWTENCGEGVDTLAFTRLRNIDVMSFHLYPDHWTKDAAWGTEWIERHIQDARRLHKPSMLGEYGLQDKSIRNPVYKQWTDTVLRYDGTGALYWILSGKLDDGTYYADYDGFTVYCPSPVCITLSNFGKLMNFQFQLFPPVADHDTAVTEYNTPATLTPLANDIAYFGLPLLPDTLDLDPTTAGRQTTQAVPGGTFTLQPDATVIFSPADGFAGRVQITYTVNAGWRGFPFNPAIQPDSLNLDTTTLDASGKTQLKGWLKGGHWNQTSNPAELTVIVKPNPTAPITMFSYETGAEGWAAANWNDVGTVEQSADFYTDGNYGLKVNATAGGWFGLDFPAPIDLSAKGNLRFDLKTLSAGTSKEVALKVGDSWAWCEGGGWSWIPAETTTTVDLNLLTDLGCAAPDLSKVQALYVWFSGPGTFYIDYVRGE